MKIIAYTQVDLVSGDCKRETGEEHAKVISTVIEGVDSLNTQTKLRIISLASDGEIQRGTSFIQLTFTKKLQQNFPIYPFLKALNFLNLYVGNDDLTCDKDWKHIFKCWRNLLLRQWGQWDHSPRCLKLPAMSQDSKDIPDSADHISVL